MIRLLSGVKLPHLLAPPIGDDFPKSNSWIGDPSMDINRRMFKVVSTRRFRNLDLILPSAENPRSQSTVLIWRTNDAQLVAKLLGLLAYLESSPASQGCCHECFLSNGIRRQAVYASSVAGSTVTASISLVQQASESHSWSEASRKDMHILCQPIASIPESPAAPWVRSVHFRIRS